MSFSTVEVRVHLTRSLFQSLWQPAFSSVGYPSISNVCWPSMSTRRPKARRCRTCSHYCSMCRVSFRSGAWGCIHSTITVILGYFYYGNSVMNPVLYTMLTRKMRKALLEMFRCNRERKRSITTSPVSMSKFSRQYSRTSISALTLRVYGRKSSPMNPTRPMIAQTYQFPTSYGTDGQSSRRTSPLGFSLGVPDTPSAERKKSPPVLISDVSPRRYMWH